MKIQVFILEGNLTISQSICVVPQMKIFSHNFFIPMRILGALGLALTIVLLRSLVPEIFHAFEKTLLLFFSILQSVLSIGQGAVEGMASIVR